MVVVGVNRFFNLMAYFLSLRAISLDSATRFCYPGSMAARKRVKGLYSKRGWWYFQPPTPKGGGPRPRPVALGTQDYVEAILKAVEEGSKVRLDQAEKKGRLDEILPRYYRAKAEDSPDTRRVREMILGNFSEVLGNPRTLEIDAEMMAGWRDHLATKGGTKDGKKGIAGTTAKSYLITVRAFLNWAKGEGYVKGDPMERLKRQTRINSTKVQDFLTELDREKALQPRMPDHLRLVLLLGFYAGLRDKEMLAMNPAWIWISPKRDRGTISVQDTVVTYEDGTKGRWRPKGRKMRVIPMHPVVLKFFKTYGSPEPWTLRPDKVLWPKDEKQSKRYDARKALATHAAATGVRKLNFHTLRHSFATHLAMKDVPLATIAALLGDSLKVTEDHYAGFSPSRKNPLAVL